MTGPLVVKVRQDVGEAIQRDERADPEGTGEQAVAKEVQARTEGRRQESAQAGGRRVTQQQRQRADHDEREGQGQPAANGDEIRPAVDSLNDG